MTEFVGQIPYKPFFTGRKTFLIDKTPIALIQRKCFFGGNRSRYVTIPGESLELRKLGGDNHGRYICVHNPNNIMRGA
ncbi:hypothetical protein SAMN05428953_101585 [Mesorhizobium muleiense]|uniref:Uncharacterized protein n=1 Tax=Mesorhizobium muleiense TaxID=1004279 RepID=A0A1G8J3Y5_9HYPH|nr:hypothetical protein SAMN05428953_101585 [Mesorhizobium muleiense]